MNKSVKKDITFYGPYAFLKTNGLLSIFELSLKKGVYVWTVPFNNKELIHYVGITDRTFGERMAEHLKGYLSGEYGINDPRELQKGRRVRIWNGLWRGADIEDFKKRHNELFPKMLSLLKIYKIYVAPLDCEIRLMERIEAAIANHLYGQDGVVGNFQEIEIRYKKRKESEEPVIVKLKYNSKIIGLPQILKV